MKFICTFPYLISIMAVTISIISLIISCCIAKQTIKSQKEMLLTEHVLQLNQIAIQYPYLEDNDFCADWLSHRTSKDEKYMRYDNYCCIVFNLISQIWEYFKGNKKKIENFLAIKELVVRHKLWWRHPSGITENIEGYDPEFRKFVDEYIEG